MNNLQNQTKRWLLTKVTQIPFIYSLVTNSRFKLERRLIKGINSNSNNHKSIIHFSVNKAATQYTKSIISRCAKHNGLQHVQMNEYARHSDFPYLDHLSEQEMKKYQHLFIPTGYLYSVFGGMIDGIPSLENYYTILMVRDPRDVVTSWFYSIDYSHSPPGVHKSDEFYENAKYAQEFGIDKFVIKNADKTRVVFQRYLDLLVNKHSNYHLTRYEDMTNDFESWLSNLLHYCGLDVSSSLRQELLDEAYSIRPKNENINKHIRQAKPGDHKRKLNQDTIDYIEELFADILKGFGYL